MKAGFVGDDAFWSDRCAYADALDSFSNDSSSAHTDVLALMKEVQPAANVIWGDPRVSGLGFVAFVCWSFSTYFSGTLSRMDCFSRTELPRRLRSLAAEDIQTCFEDLSCCAKVPGESAPKRFSRKWLRELSGAPSGPALAIPPRMGEHGKESMGNLLKSCQAFFEWFVKEHLERETERIQEP